MDLQIAAILAVDGIANGAIYVLIALGTVLIFSVTRVMFVPFGDIAAFSALTLAMLQMGRLPGTVMLVVVLAAIALAVECVTLARTGRLAAMPRAVLWYGVLPCLPAGIAFATEGVALGLGWQMMLALLLVLPIAPLVDRIAFRPLADASVLVLLIVAVAVHFALSGWRFSSSGQRGSGRSRFRGRSSISAASSSARRPC